MTTTGQRHSGPSAADRTCVIIEGVTDLLRRQMPALMAAEFPDPDSPAGERLDDALEFLSDWGPRAQESLERHKAMLAEQGPDGIQ